MERMNKVSKYLDSIGVSYSYLETIQKRLIGGRSFYNDGTYCEDFYKLGEEYKLGVKVTGRPAFYLYEKSRLRTILGFSQDEAIISLKRILAKEN